MTVLFDAATDHHQLLRDFRRAYVPRTQVIDGVTWSYPAGGDGATSIVFLPGVLGVADTAFHYVLAFAPQYRVRSLDYPPALRTVDGVLAGMATLLAELGAVHLVGGSYSGPLHTTLPSVTQHRLLRSSFPIRVYLIGGAWSVPYG